LVDARWREEGLTGDLLDQGFYLPGRYGRFQSTQHFILGKILRYIPSIGRRDDIINLVLSDYKSAESQGTTSREEG
jgi:hypothetical protein